MKTVIDLRKLLSKSKILTTIYHVYLFIRGKGHFVFVTQEFFTGWGMTTGTRTPWMDGGGHKITQDFYSTDIEVKRLVKEKHFNLSQFSKDDSLKALNSLMWRHYIVYWSSVYAINNTASTEKNFVECGVCDGLTAFYALSAAENMNKSFKAYLYDSWDAMEDHRLLESEKESAGEYAYLNMESTIKNLGSFNSDDVIFNKGYIPDVFQCVQNPESLIWLHIDLNSSVPTIDALDLFWDRLEIGGVVLFDDYAWTGHQATQTSVEKWSVDKNATLFHIPTGQALVIKNKGSQS